MKNVKHIELRHGLSVAQLVNEMENCGVLGAGKIGVAARLITEMFKDPSYTVFLTLAGALVPGGLRKMIAQLIEEEYIDVVITTGANMVHDMIEALGYNHKIGSFKAEDQELRREEIGRIGDIFVEQKAFQRLETWLHKFLEELIEQNQRRISPSEMLREIGRRIADKNSILATATRKNIPIICPGLPDSIAGFQIWVYGQDNDLVLDPLGDTTKLLEIVYEAQKSGIIILGGGWPKHYALFANTFRDGVDTAVQITMDRPEIGGLSGASLEEAISWSKVKSKDQTVTVVCDVTIAFPLVIAAALEQCNTS